MHNIVQHSHPLLNIDLTLLQSKNKKETQRKGGYLEKQLQNEQSFEPHFLLTLHLELFQLVRGFRLILPRIELLYLIHRRLLPSLLCPRRFWVSVDWGLLGNVSLNVMDVTQPVSAVFKILANRKNRLRNHKAGNPSADK